MHSKCRKYRAAFRAAALYAKPKPAAPPDRPPECRGDAGGGPPAGENRANPSRWPVPGALLRPPPGACDTPRKCAECDAAPRTNPPPPGWRRPPPYGLRPLAGAGRYIRKTQRPAGNGAVPPPPGRHTNRPTLHPPIPIFNFPGKASALRSKLVNSSPMLRPEFGSRTAAKFASRRPQRLRESPLPGRCAPDRGCCATLPTGTSCLFGTITVSTTSPARRITG